MELGYTEPDPRIDLSGEDVKKKLLILGREIGLEMESEEIIIEPFLSKDSMEAKSLDLFLSSLDGVDARLKERIIGEEEGCKLCFIASIDHGDARIGLRIVGPDHPFSTLSGSDNMIVITSQRYFERPLVVRGPGAGAEVTAAGVFAELIKIGHLF